MSIEQRVTDAMVADVIEGITEYRDTGGSHFVEDDIWLDLRDSRAALAATKAKLEAAENALSEAEDTLRLAERPAFPDPDYHEHVKKLGMAIGFGALMTTASAGWREFLLAKGMPTGGEFVAGPSHATVVSTLKKVRAVLTMKEAPDATR